ncbi:hypothetical protein NW768_011310 [Fusarium equiseti]|uniref:CBM-cenC domain-containing protein n=1 Tax=Fusarium equiseti TaxID=61235 RepID=A0ABQ8QXR7_FUSEQ|nr:hypothetical protein NW768_011310 [Fusarium equiseti]
MIAKTFAAAFIAASFMAGSQASPCKASSRTTDMSTISEILPAATSTEAPATIETTFSTSGVSSVEGTTLTSSQSEINPEIPTISDGPTATTATSTTDLSSTVKEDSIDTSATSEVITTTAGTATATPTQDLSSTFEGSSTETSTGLEPTTSNTLSTKDLSFSLEESGIVISRVSTDATTTLISTAEIITTTAESPTISEETTTTTTVVAADPTFLINAGFDDETDTTQPWTMLKPETGSVSLDSTIKHEGKNSAKLGFTTASSATHVIGQELAAPIKSVVPYTVSAWVRGGSGCFGLSLRCAYKTIRTVWVESFRYNAFDQWMQISMTCRYPQHVIDMGGLYVLVEVGCVQGSTAWIDSISFTPQS